MEYVIICLAALLASALTFFSGFGLGTILMPVFALFFPVEVAIGLTAIVHFLNGLFKVGLVGRSANKRVVLYFGIPAALAALVGAAVLAMLAHLSPLFTYQISGHEFQVTPVKFVISLLLLIFTLLELSPKFQELSFDTKYLPFGGVLSGFFGGLSGNQGALRTAFLIKSGLTKEVFIASGVVIAAMIDIARLLFYSQSTLTFDRNTNYLLLASATVSAFIGAFLGNRLLKKITMDAVRWIVSIMLIVISILLGAGII